MAEARVTFQPEGTRSHAPSGTSLLDAARMVGVGVQSICGGRASCGKCTVIVRQGSELLSPVTESELKFLSEAELRSGYRLACCALTAGKGSIIVEIPLETRLSRHRLLVEGVEAPVEFSPTVRKFVVKMQKPTLVDVTPDTERLIEAMKGSLEIGEPNLDYEALKALPRIVREGGWTATITLWNNQEVICVEPESTSHRLYGVAVDIGTTKIACYLVDLNKDKISAITSAPNPQIPYGEDVISRITFSSESPQNLEELQRVLVDEMNRLVSEACEKSSVKPEEVYDMAVVGNTAMHHIFLNLNPKFVSLSPFPAVIGGSLNVKARSLGLRINRGAYVHTLPCVAGFVGADAVADMLATEIYRINELSMCVDIGTNTEIMLGNERKLMACSCASGPAFEGAHIKHGMRAATGAIERVFIDPENLELTYETIEDEKPRGLCGSAIVDVVAEMLKARVIDKGGKVNTELKSERLRVKEGIPELVIAWGDEAEGGNDIVVTQRDVREIQLAKAAIYTGASILMKKMGVTASEIKHIFIAGAFGTYVDPRSAKVIGMYPDVPLDRVKLAGNTAGSGGRMALKSVTARKMAEEIRTKVDYLELGADPEFEKEFTKALFFPHLELDRFPNARRVLGF